MSDKRKTTTIETKVNVRKAFSEAVRDARMTDEEERVIRMRHGLGLASGDALELRGQSFAETRAQLAMIEKEALDVLRRGPPTPEPEANTSVKARIIARLRED